MVRVIAVSNPRLAQAFVDYMATQGVVLEVRATGDAAEIWLADEAHLEQVQHELQQFLLDPFNRRYQAAIYTWFETAKHAFERGNQWQNMGGIENHLEGGLFSFKSKFRPEIEEMIGEFNLPVSPLYQLSNLAYTIRKKLRRKRK